MQRKLLPKAQRASEFGGAIDEATRTASLTWTTGAKVMRSGWEGPFYESLEVSERAVDLSRLNLGAPVLADHENSIHSVVGVVEKAWIENGEGRAKVRFADTPEGEKVWQLVKTKILRNISVGYSVQFYEDITSEKERTPHYIARCWSPAEISIVGVPADAHSQIRNVNQSELSEVQFIHSKENMKTQIKEIRSLVKASGLDESVALDIIERDLTIDEARTEVTTKLAEKSPAIDSTIRMEVGTTHEDKQRTAFENSLLARIDSNFKPEAGNPYQGRSLIDSLERFMGGRRFAETDLQLAKRAILNSNLPLILANVAEKSAQMRYQLAPRSFEKFTRRDTVRNYKSHSRVRAGDFAQLPERAENADYAEASPFSEQQELIVLKDHGIVYTISSQAVVNDDLSLLRRVAEEGAVAASRLDNKLVYDVLKSNPTMGDSVALFHASHGNQGTVGALSATTVGEAVKLMRKQTSLDGLDPLNLAPAYLICGPDSEMIARQILAEIQPSQSANVNPWAGFMELIVDAQITDDQYFFAASPSMIEGIILFNLEGQESPKMDARVKWENDSLQLKCSYSVASKCIDWRGLVRNKATAYA